jgi:hypothetical protein
MVDLIRPVALVAIDGLLFPDGIWDFSQELRALPADVRAVVLTINTPATSADGRAYAALDTITDLVRRGVFVVALLRTAWGIAPLLASKCSYVVSEPAASIGYMTALGEDPCEELSAKRWRADLGNKEFAKIFATGATFGETLEGRFLVDKCGAEGTALDAVEMFLKNEGLQK